MRSDEVVVSPASATLPPEETVPDDISLANLTVQCTLSIVTGAVGDGVAPHLLTLGKGDVRERGS